MKVCSAVRNTPRCLGTCRSTSRKSLVICAFRNKHRYDAPSRLVKEPLVVTVDPLGQDLWRLEPLIELLRKGGVGIIPTDTLPSLVCDIENASAVKKLYSIKELSPKKPLSILCRGLSDIGFYTTGFPRALAAGETDVFSRAKRVLPGPYTFILPASRQLPKMCVDYMRNRTKHRNSVGVRWPNHPITQAVLDGLGHPLLCTSAHVDGEHHLSEDTEVADSGTLLELYGNKGLDFIVDVPPYIASYSTVIDMTTVPVEVVREGRGSVELFV